MATQELIYEFPRAQSPEAEKATTRDGTAVTFRPIREDDELKMVHFHESLSDRSVYLRYFHYMHLDTRVTHERLARVCVVDPDREMVLVAETKDGEIAGVGRLSREPESDDAEFALLVSDAWHEHGIGTELLRRLVAIARQEEIHHVSGDILAENAGMQDVCRHLGFQMRYSLEDHVVRASLETTSPPQAARGC
jgi:acetyltransferase